MSIIEQAILIAAYFGVGFVVSILLQPCRGMMKSLTPCPKCGFFWYAIVVPLWPIATLLYILKMFFFEIYFPFDGSGYLDETQQKEFNKWWNHIRI